MGLGLYVYPRFAVYITTGKAVPIERLRGHCLWYPSVDLNGQNVSGHVLYVSKVLHEAMMEVALGVGDGVDAEVAVEGGEPGISHRLAAPLGASKYASVPRLIEAVVERARQALPVTKRKLLAGLSTSGLSPEECLVKAEGILHHEGLHVLVPLSVGERYQLFTDATEALLPVSPLVLQRAPRLCFVLLSTDDLVEKRDSPWMRQAIPLMVLPVNAMRTPAAVDFVGDLPALRAALGEENLMGQMATSLQEVTGGWPDLCDRFYKRLERLGDIDGLRQWMQQLVLSLRQAERDPARCEELWQVALGGAPEPADLPPPPSPGQSGPGPGDTWHPGHGHTHEVLKSLLNQPRPFTWDEHGRAYLDGLLGWDRGLAVPRSRVIELVQRGRLGYGRGQVEIAGRSPAETAEGAHGQGQAPAGAPPGRHTVRWLHVSDFHFSQKTASDGDIVLQALVATVADFRRHGREVDLIFVTGDIAFGGGESEYRQAEAFLGKLCEAAGVPRWAVHIVPGNHDVFRPYGEGLARTMADPDSAHRYFQPTAHRHHLVKLENFRAFYDRFYAAQPPPAGPPRAAAPGQATAGAEVIRVRDLSIGLLPLNSAWFAQDDQDSGMLLVGESVVRAGLQQIQGAELRIAFLHHPLSELSHIERKLVQERITEGCHFLLRGHLHDTEANWHNTPYQQMLMMAAGAAYQGRTRYQNRALYVEVEVHPSEHRADVRPYPIRYELTGHDRWTLDTSIFPRSYPTYLETMPLKLSI